MKTLFERKEEGLNRCISNPLVREGGELSYERFYLALPFIVEALEVIKITHTKLNKFEKIYIKGWDAKSKADTTQFLKSLTKFEFGIGSIALYKLLHPVARITQKLQGGTFGATDEFRKEF